jgi:phosphoribosylamine-glycine ligase
MGIGLVVVAPDNSLAIGMVDALEKAGVGLSAPMPPPPRLRGARFSPRSS